MEIEQSSLYPEIRSILAGGPNAVHFVWTAIVHVNQRGLDLPVMKVLSVDNIADFEQNYTDEITLTCVIPGGAFANQIYPFQNDLDITIIKSPVGEVGSAATSGQAVQVQRYQATLLDQGDPQIEGNQFGAMSQEELDLTNLLPIRFQLIDKSLEQIRMAGIGGIWRQTTMDDFLKGVMTKMSQDVQVDQNLKVKGVDMVPASNQNTMEHVIIPHGTRLVDVPNYVQEKCGGVYSAGLGCYMRNGYWYIYPCYDTTRMNTARATATVILLPPNKFTNIERTFKIAGGDGLVILATGQVKFRGDSTPQQLNHGNGVRFTDASKLMEGFSVTDKNVALAARGNINNEYLSTQRPNGLNNVQMGRNRITANPFTASTDLARRNGSVIAAVWENSDDSLIAPSTMVQVMWLEDDTVQTLQGVLSKMATYTEMNQPGMLSGRHITRTALSIFVQNPKY
jgi:hypothetical protein